MNDVIKSYKKKLISSALEAGGHSYSLLFQDGEEYQDYKFLRRPCYGEMRPYQKDYPDEVSDDVVKPSDLPHVFPKGSPVAYAVHLINKAETYQYIFSQESPWQQAFKNAEIISIGDEKVLYSEDTEIDPTLFVHGLMYHRGANEYVTRLLKKGLPFDIATLLGANVPNSYGYPLLYMFAPFMSCSRFLCNKPQNLSSNAKTFRERGVYNRPRISYIWTDTKRKDSLKNLFPDLFTQTFQRKTADEQVEILCSTIYPKLNQWKQDHAC